MPCLNFARTELLAPLSIGFDELLILVAMVITLYVTVANQYKNLMLSGSDDKGLTTMLPQL